MKFYRVQVIGKVQGVAFRYYSKLKADELGLVGTVENQQDGCVIIEVKGKEQNIDQFIHWCHQGSPASDVKKVICTPLSIQEDQEYSEFSILR